MKRIIKSMEDKYLKPSLDMVRSSFADWSNEEEADLVVRLIKETRSMSTYIPELELIMVNDEKANGIQRGDRRGQSAELQKPRLSDLSRFRYHCRRKRRTSCAGVPDGEGACCRCA